MKNLFNIFKIIVCMLLITSVMSCAGSKKNESTGEYVDDSAITTKVKAAIFKEDTLKSLQINVETYKGVVQLSGFVDSAQSVQKAETVTKNVKGVKSVKNDLVVR